MRLLIGTQGLAILRRVPLHPCIRAVRNEDADAIVTIVGRCFSLYPGCVLDLEVEEVKLLTPADSFEAFWVLELDGRLVGMIGAERHPGPDGGAWVELKKLYLDPDVHGEGLARPLVAKVEEYAREHGALGIDLWSDTRFQTAHRVYEHLGYTRQDRTRELHDLSETVEFRFTKRLDG